MESSSGFFTGELDQNQMDYMNGNSNFQLDEFLEFPKETDQLMADAFFDSITGGDSAQSSSSFTVVDSSNSSVSGGHGPFNGNLSCRSFTDIQFSGNELCVPYDDLADLEWLSNLVEESFSSDNLQDLQLINPPTQNGKSPSAVAAAASSSVTTNLHNLSPIFSSDVSVPGKARSKRSRAAPCDWSSRLLLLSQPNSDSKNNHISPKPAPARKREQVETGRRCLHCASEKTPQWRTGPMGPKTLCNACGVRYKSGRLVPEYRPASSPTFVSATHSNSHRKVLELQRQKDLRMQQQLLSHASIFGISNRGAGDDFFHHPHPCQMPNFGGHAADYRFMS